MNSLQRSARGHRAICEQLVISIPFSSSDISSLPLSLRTFRCPPLCVQFQRLHSSRQASTTAELPGQLSYFVVEGAPPPSARQAPPIQGLLVHGLLGQGKNWRSFTRALVSDLARDTGRRWRILLPDLRGHGGSGQRLGFNPPHDLQVSPRPRLAPSFSSAEPSRRQ